MKFFFGLDVTDVLEFASSKIVIELLFRYVSNVTSWSEKSRKKIKFFRHSSTMPILPLVHDVVPPVLDTEGGSSFAFHCASIRSDGL